MIELEGSPKPTLTALLKDVGNGLDFLVKTEVEASESAFVDVVWFDKRFPLPLHGKSFKMRYELVLPIVGFEIELRTARDAKHIKGSVSNLNNLGAQLGVIVIGQDNLVAIQESPAGKGKKPSVIRKALCDRVYRWVYAESQPNVRIIVMFEKEVREWAERLRLKPSSVGVPESLPASLVASP
jgi:hypothetical protein